MYRSTKALEVLSFEAGELPFQIRVISRQLDILLFEESINGGASSGGFDAVQHLLHSGAASLIPLALLLHFS